MDRRSFLKIIGLAPLALVIPLKIAVKTHSFKGYYYDYYYFQYYYDHTTYFVAKTNPGYFIREVEDRDLISDPSALDRAEYEVKEIANACNYKATT